MDVHLRWRALQVAMLAALLCAPAWAANPPSGTLSSSSTGGLVRRTRHADGGGDGRIDHLRFTATDGKGSQCAGEVKVCVPHDRRPDATCGDGGALYSSAGGADVARDRRGAGTCSLMCPGLLVLCHVLNKLRFCAKNPLLRLWGFLKRGGCHHEVRCLEARVRPGLPKGLYVVRPGIDRPGRICADRPGLPHSVA